jgi:O-6-methylguanine DNA methyltransferase
VTGNSDARSFSIESQLDALRAAAPASLLIEVELGTGLVDGYTVVASPVGDVIVAFNPNGVSAVDFADEGFGDRFRARFLRPLVAAEPPAAWVNRIEEAVDRGRPGRLPIDFRSVTPFQQRILELAATIPRGQVRPYSWLARAAGRSGAARAVGSTMARNPVPLIVPCHRVIRSDGKLGAYSLGGPENKWELLAYEGAEPGRIESIAAAGIRLLGSDTTGIFCYPTCHQARRISEAHLRRFRSESEAKASGFRPCRICRPGGD